jgi:hypothetical protein
MRLAQRRQQAQPLLQLLLLGFSLENFTRMRQDGSPCSKDTTNKVTRFL